VLLAWPAGHMLACRVSLAVNRSPARCSAPQYVKPLVCKSAKAWEHMRALESISTHSTLRTRAHTHIYALCMDMFVHIGTRRKHTRQNTHPHSRAHAHSHTHMHIHTLYMHINTHVDHVRARLRADPTGASHLAAPWL